MVVPICRQTRAAAVARRAGSGAGEPVRKPASGGPATGRRFPSPGPAPRCAPARRPRACLPACSPPAHLLAHARQLRLARPVDLLVQVKQHVGPVADQQAPLHAHAPLLHAPDLLKQPRQVHHHAIADHAGGFGVEDARGDEVQLVLVALAVIDGMASVCAALEEGGHRVGKSEGRWVGGWAGGRSVGITSILPAASRRLPTALTTIAYAREKQAAVASLPANTALGGAAAPWLRSPAPEPQSRIPEPGYPPACPCPRLPTACPAPRTPGAQTCPRGAARRPLPVPPPGSAGVRRRASAGRAAADRPPGAPGGPGMRRRPGAAAATPQGPHASAAAAVVSASCVNCLRRLNGRDGAQTQQSKGTDGGARRATGPGQHLLASREVAGLRFDLGRADGVLRAPGSQHAPQRALALPAFGSPEPLSRFVALKRSWLFMEGWQRFWATRAASVAIHALQSGKGGAGSCKRGMC